ncbi:hypothetical protein EVAR_62955_1 [Eumeta japonica]|uniref:Uncharacterized protein n=1 Tax=Eumeta variegata TaxID=151549 RepID=A0A4C1ZFF1_EUMVA|nr:hypothetical protein EVAR_62955_1 [Eumeta japonica]
MGARAVRAKTKLSIYESLSDSVKCLRRFKIPIMSASVQKSGKIVLLIPVLNIAVRNRIKYVEEPIIETIAFGAFFERRFLIYAFSSSAVTEERLTLGGESSSWASRFTSSK